MGAASAMGSAVAVAGLIAGCQLSSSVTPTASVSPADPPVSSSGLAWSTVMTTTLPVSAVSETSGWLVLETFPRTRKVVRMVEPASGRTWGFVTDPGWLSENPVVVGDRVFLVEYNDAMVEAGKRGDVRIRAGRLDESPKVVATYTADIPTLLVVDDVLYAATFTDSTSGGRTCLDQVEGKGAPLFCVAGAMQRLTRVGDAFTFGTTVPGHRRCADLFVVDLDPLGAPRRLPTTGCVHSGEATGDVVAWTSWTTEDESEGVNFEKMPVSVRVGSGPPVDLGLGSMGSVRACGDAIYWNTAAEPMADKAAALHRWTPERGAEVVFSPKGVEDLLGSVTCQVDGGLEVQSLADTKDELVTTVSSTTTRFTEAAKVWPTIKIWTADGKLVDAASLGE